ncbi:MAG: glycosyltransferase family 39 protein [Scytolyngbya sp. HA4215-MV1]|jgi:4-amino-4-deoxy-L-arabinose transferase-like glycosyltransferase|nr:glycosyltransferase family 39 protein [Scytolyngbya sp. HA4215-MV1]
MLWLFLIFILLRLLFWLVAFPNPDEAYYWLWGQHPALSYYDHPPLIAWVGGLATAWLGRSSFTLRLPTFLANLAFFYLIFLCLRHLYGDRARSYFGIVLLAIAASPLYFMFLALAWPDALMITLALLASYWFITFIDVYAEDGQGESWRLYGTAAAIALAILAKYNAIFVPLGFLATVISTPPLRPLLHDRRVYGAVAIAAIAFLPILFWNESNDFQSLRYYLSRSADGSGASFKVGEALGFLALAIVSVSPFYIYGMISRLQSQFQPFTKAQKNGQLTSFYPTVAFWIFALSTGILTLTALVSTALYYWNITAYLLLFPLLPRYFLDTQGQWIRLRLFWAGQMYGLLFAVVFVVHYSLLPISVWLSPDADPDSRMMFGWQTVAAEVQKLQQNTTEPSFLLATDYRTASALAYQLNQKTVTVISDRIDQFDFWYAGDRALQGKNAIILSDTWHPANSTLLAHFAHCSTPRKIVIARWGIWVKDYFLTQGYGFRGGEDGVEKMGR